jgi:hypothetical protein
MDDGESPGHERRRQNHDRKRGKHGPRARRERHSIVAHPDPARGKARAGHGAAVCTNDAADRLRPRPCRPLRPGGPGCSLRPLRPWRSSRPLRTCGPLWACGSRRPLRALRPGLAPRDRRLARVTAVGRRVDQPQLAVLRLVTAGDHPAAADVGNQARTLRMS